MSDYPGESEEKLAQPRFAQRAVIAKPTSRSKSKTRVNAADLENVKLTEQTNLAVFYFQLRGQDALEELCQTTVEVDQQSLDLTRVLNKLGLDNDEAVAQAEIALESAKAAATNAGIARAQYEHAIALLVGEPASSFSVPVRELTTQVPDIPVGVPSELLGRRPDIAAAERTMAEANALIGAQKGSLLSNAQHYRYSRI